MFCQGVGALLVCLCAMELQVVSHHVAAAIQSQETSFESRQPVLLATEAISGMVQAGHHSWLVCLLFVEPGSLSVCLSASCYC